MMMTMAAVTQIQIATEYWIVSSFFKTNIEHRPACDTLRTKTNIDYCIAIGLAAAAAEIILSNAGHRDAYRMCAMRYYVHTYKVFY